MRLAREFRRHDWRTMLSELSSSEFSEWFDFYQENYFSDVLLDAECCALRATMLALTGHQDIPLQQLSLLQQAVESETMSDDELMAIGEGLFGGVRYGPDNQ